MTLPKLLHSMPQTYRRLPSLMLPIGMFAPSISHQPWQSCSLCLFRQAWITFHLPGLCNEITTMAHLPTCQHQDKKLSWRLKQGAGRGSLSRTDSMHSELSAQEVYGGTLLTLKTEIASALNEHSLIVGPRRNRATALPLSLPSGVRSPILI